MNNINCHECGINHHGSSSAMVKDAAVNIFNRRINKYKMRYINFYSDVDTERFASIENIYPGIKVTKFECIGHVQKRMGKRLRTLRKTVKGLGGTGRLNEKPWWIKSRISMVLPLDEILAKT